MAKKTASVDIPKNRQITVEAEPVKKSGKNGGTRAAAAMKLLQGCKK